MNQDLQNLEIKVENEGTTPQGRLTATEWNILVAAVKSLDLKGGSVDITSILQAVADAGYATQEWVNNQDYATTTDFNKFVKDFVTLDTTQAISGIKDFTNGLKVGGLSVYKSQADTIYLNANLVVRGGITAFGTNETITASIFEALPIDGATLKRTENGVLYVDTTVVGGGGGTGGGISIADVENYLTTNSYATQDWVTGKGYITSASSITGNAGTASKLQNAVSLWGRTFDGTADLTGSLNVTTGEGYRINYNGYDLRFIVSGSSSNRGIWDNTNNNWLMYRAGSNDIYFTSGNIGFGTTSPTERLTVTGNIKASGTLIGADASISNVLNLTATTSSAFSGAQLLFSGGISRIAVSSGGSMYAYAKDFTFRSNSTTSASSIGFTMDANANIATTGNIKASGTLIGADASISNVLNLTATPSQVFAGAQILFAGGNGRIGASASGFMGLYANTFTFRPSSTTSASSSSFTIDANANLATTGNILASGAITMYYSSDERLKKNIRKVDASKTLMSLGGVYQYEYIDSEVQKNHIYEGTHYGLIYQHVKGTALDVMCHEREDGFGTLNYIHPKFISLIAGATMENISEVEKLKRKIRHLESKVKQLENRA